MNLILNNKRNKMSVANIFLITALVLRTIFQQIFSDLEYLENLINFKHKRHS